MSRGIALATAVSGTILLVLAFTVGSDARVTTPAAAAAVASPKPALLPIVKQALRNNCETAALSMLLAWKDVRVGQLTLQRRLVKSGPLDPRTDPLGGLPMWGDPDDGYVGRAEGGGVAGGFGVYQGPIRRLAAQYRVRLVNLSRRDVSVLYSRLSLGIPVMVWVGLSDGPYRRWLAPSGRRIVANMGEHTVVLTGVAGGSVLVNDPLYGIKTTWTKEKFEQMWPRLGRRALSYPA